MMLAKEKIAGTLLLAAATLGGAGWLANSAPAAEPSVPVARADDKPNDDRAAIQGTWQCTKFETKDYSPDEPRVKLMAAQQWIFTADKITMRMPSEKETPTAHYKLDPSKTPKEIDFKAEIGYTGPGVYSLDGDILKVCIPTPGTKSRPTEVAVGDAGKNILYTFKRVSGGKEKPKEDKPSK